MFRGHELKQEIESKNIYKKEILKEMVQVEVDSRKDLDEDTDNNANIAHMSIINTLRSSATSKEKFKQKIQVSECKSEIYILNQSSATSNFFFSDK